MQKNGHYANGKQRWFCPSCKQSVSWRNPEARHTKEREWFRRWIVEGYSIRQLSNQSGYSPAKLYRMINYYLQQTPTQSPTVLGESQYFILDGTFINRPHTLISLMDAQTHILVACQYGVSESSEPRLRAFLAGLMKYGLHPRSFTVDGNPHVTNVLRSLWPGVA